MKITFYIFKFEATLLRVIILQIQIL